MAFSYDDLSDLQKKLEKTHKSLAKAQKKLAKKEPASAKDDEKINKEIKELEKEIVSLSESLATRIEELEKNKQDPNKKKDAEKELAEWRQYKKEFAEEKRQKDEQKAKSKTKTYEENRDKILSVASAILQSRNGVEQALSAIKVDANGKIDVSIVDMLKVASTGLKAAADIGISGLFYKKEGEKLAGILSGQIQEDPNNPSFFLKVAQDPKFTKFLNENSNRILENLAPQSVPLVFSIIGNLDLATRNYNTREEDIKKLPEKEKELAKLKESNNRSDNTKIATLEEEINSLKAIVNAKTVAERVKALEKQGIDAKKTQDLMAVIAPFAKEILSNHDLIKGLVPIGLAATKMEGNNPEEIKDIIKKGAPLVNIIVETLGKNLPTILLNKDVQDTINKALNLEPAKKAITEVGLDLEEVKKLVPDVLNVAKATMPAVVDIAKVALGPEMLVKLYEAATKDSTSIFDMIKEAGLEAFVKDIMPDVLNVAKNAIPGVVNIVQEATNDRGNLLSIYNDFTQLQSVTQKLTEEEQKELREAEKILQLYKGIEYLGSKKSLELDEKKSFDSIITAIKELGITDLKLQEANKTKARLDEKAALDDSDIAKRNSHLVDMIKKSQKIVAAAVPEMKKLLMSDNITNIAAKASENNPLKQFLEPLGINRKFVQDVLPTTASIASDLLIIAQKALEEAMTNPSDLKTLMNSFTQKEAMNLEKTLEAGGRVMANLETVLSKDLPEFLNNKKIINLIDTATQKNTVIKQTLEEMGIPQQLVHDAADKSMPFVADLLPHLAKIATNALNEHNRKKLESIIKDTQTLIGIKSTSDSKDAKEIHSEEQLKTAKGLVSKIMDFKTNDPVIKEVIDRDLPKILQNHAKELGPVIDQFLQQTPIGKKIRVRGQEILETLGPKAPKLLNAAEYWSKGQTGKLIGAALDIIFDKDVLKLGLKAIFGKKINKEEKTKEKQETKPKKVFKNMALAKGLDEIRASIEGKVASKEIEVVIQSATEMLKQQSKNNSNRLQK